MKMLLTVATLHLALGCSNTTDPEGTSTAEDPADSTTDTDDRRRGDDEANADGTGLADALARLDGEGDDLQAITDAGTDSAPTTAAPPVSPSVADVLTRFGKAYLGFDYRDDPARRLDALSGLVAPATLDELATPLPAALAETLVVEQRVTTVEVLSITGLEVLSDGSGVYQLAYVVTDGSESSEASTLTIVLGADELIRDVR